MAKSCVSRYCVDWFRVICELDDCKYDIQKISESIEIAYTTIHGWKMGTEPRHADGERLIKLWCKVTGKSRKDLPVLDASCWWSYHL
ncbi:hypothetical protein DM558_00375 [Entomomonas moraniae]|uniref:XRE family transcriptional regulator n=1 Tax=Entomomonas moraniae TaxID=2213226 RepID=A0A3Q9JH09_9GAMM|nr:hypothetical protein DM558_00375 [Entomomonas moraniae]